MPEADAGARAAVLGRLWGALTREPIPGLGGVESAGSDLRLKLPDGRTLSGPARAAAPFAAVTELTLDLDCVPRRDPAELLGELGLGNARTGILRRELRDSVTNLALARAAQPRPDGGEPALARAARDPDPLAVLEQSVVDGHPLHPCCRTRTGLSPDEVRAYAPEHRPVVELPVVRIPASRWLGQTPAELILHPWQHEHVAHGFEVIRTVRARPLMSLRTLALVDDPGHHVKTAVDVQMTSAVRTVSPAAIHNGPILSRLLASLPTGTVTVMPEVSAGAVLMDGAPSRHLAVLHRRLPILHPGEMALPLAVLAAPSPATGGPIIAELVEGARGVEGVGGAGGAGGVDPDRFVAELVELTVPSLLTLLARGIALEAHGQNLLLVLRHGRPARLLYRDLGGVRVSPARLCRHGIDPPPLLGDLATDDPEILRTKLLASLVATVLHEVIVTLARAGLNAQRAWDGVAEAVRRHDGPDRVAFFRDTLPLKATTAMRLAADPLEDLWAAIPNPMAGLG